MTKRLHSKSLIFIGVALFGLAVATYEYIVPTAIGQQYLDTFYKELSTVNSALIRAADSGNLQQFSDPDIALAARVDQTASAISLVAATHARLNAFKDKIDPLPALPYSGLLGDYEVATVKREHARRMILQSHEALDQYSRVLTFLAGYTPLQRNLDDYFARIAAVDDFDTLGGRGPDMAAIAANIRADADVLRGLAVPPDFVPLKSESLGTFEQAAQGFERLAFGLDIAVNSDIYAADAMITAASVKNKTTDKTLLVSLTDTSPIFARLAELPEKVDYIER